MKVLVFASVISVKHIKLINIMSILKTLVAQFLRVYPKFKINRRVKIETHGYGYGAWSIVENSLSDRSVVYSFGVGKNVDFEVSLFDKYRCRILMFDPTPDSISFINDLKLDSKLEFIPRGISNRNGIVKFYSPLIEDGVSFSVFQNKNCQNDHYVSVEMRSLDSFMSEFNHKKIDLLKLDIEGIEYDVITDILNKRIDITQIIVEFHHGIYDNLDARMTERIITLLKSADFNLCHASNSCREFLFYKN